MRKIVVACLFIHLWVSGFGQTSIKHARAKSWQSRVYRISADTAEKYASEYVAFPDHYLEETPFALWHADSAKHEELPVGNYLILSVKETELVAEYYCQSNLLVFPLNNQHRVQFEVKNRNGSSPQDLRLWVDKKEIKYDPLLKAFQLSRKKPDEAFIKIAVPGDTLFMELSAMEQTRNEWQQWWSNFTYTRVGKVITWPVRKVRRLVTTPAYNWFPRRYKNKDSRNGYMVFNKPKYLPGDTVKLKAYILSKRKKQYRKALNLELSYRQSNKYTQKDLGRIKPETPGAFVHEFVLGDSMDTDMQYSILFRDKKKRSRMTGSFMLEDYLLDEVAAYDLRSVKENYFSTDTLVFYAQAKDANGLALMDGRVNLYLLAKEIGQFYKERELIPDTLWKGEKAVAVNEDTRFEIPADQFPDADLSISAVAVFRNSNNEIQEKQLSIHYTAERHVIETNLEGSYVVAEYRENGKRVKKEGLLSFNDEDRKIKIQFPYREKINPYVEEYFFWTEDGNGKTKASRFYTPVNDYHVGFSRTQQQDEAGFTLYNPNRVPVHYTVYYGNNIITKGADTSEMIHWKTKLPGKKIYNVEWSYIWGGKERYGRNTIALLDKVLAATIESKETIYPGQTDTLTVSINDYKGRPAAGVNLSAVSYNSQFKEAIRVAEPPYLQRFRTRRRILFDRYELDDAGFTKKFLLGQHQQGRAAFNLDTMDYYRLLFPKEDHAVSSSRVHDFLPQLAVYITKHGTPQEIYMLYINRRFVWYNGVTDKSSYAFTCVPGYVQIGVRLKDQYIEIDSIYLQPFYKHDVSFDLEHLPKDARVEQRTEYYNYLERAQIEKQVWQLRNDDLTNYGYVWQDRKLVFIGSKQPHLIGPFDPADSLQFFKPGSFDFKFPLEAGYEYKLTPRMARLERKNIFTFYEKKAMLPKISKTVWVLGDTVVAPPRIQYEIKPVGLPFLRVNDNDNSYTIGGNGTGRLRITLPGDSSFIYAVLYRDDDSGSTRVRSYQPGYFNSIIPGRYQLVLITANYQYLAAENIDVGANSIVCIKFSKPVYHSSHPFIVQLRETYRKQIDKELMSFFEEEKEKKRIIAKETPGLPLLPGNGEIRGHVTDKKGKEPVPNAMVSLKGYSHGVVALADGSFVIRGIRPGNYVLQFSFVGYEPLEESIVVAETGVTSVDAQMLMSANSLDEVVVVGYGIQRRKSLTGSIATVQGGELTQVLMGSAAGLDVAQGGADKLQIRGMSSLSLDAKPLYVINGVPMDGLPEGFDIGQAHVNILTDASATALYGARAAAGAIIITTQEFVPKALRDKFSDYATWQPNLFTDKNGQVKFTVTYPDNITGWQTFVVGMDKKRRFTKATSFTRSFKPLLAQLSLPQFFIEGDSVSLIGKGINYTKEPFAITKHFKLNEMELYDRADQLPANGSVTEAIPISVGNDDTLQAEYTITTASGYTDGELRKIPVFKKGIEEAKGLFWILNKDSSFSFQPLENANDIILYAQNNTLDMLLDELEQLKSYPYFCMEQTASKLKGLQMEKQVRRASDQSFKGEPDIRRLLDNLQKAQLFDGGWGWWEGGETNIAITNYVTQALLTMKEYPLVEKNIRNALLFLQNRLPVLKRDQLLSVLFTMSEAGHQMDYLSYLQQLPFDSLSIYQQWQVVKIRQYQGFEYRNELKKVMDRKIETMLGAVHWGIDSYSWENNDMAATALAFKVLEREKQYTSLLQQIIQFFLERRKEGRWRNTVESASTLSAILPSVLQNNNAFAGDASLEIKTDQPFTINKFPYSGKISNTGQPVSISKKGGGMMYLTAWQEVFNTKPQAVENNFVIRSWFERSGNDIARLTAGEKTVMKISINVLKDADYVQVEIPIPAGCTYADRKQGRTGIHKEFLKNRLVMFIERMNKGIYEYEIELEPRYSGSYHLNPVTAELMYFPVFYGQNEMKKINID